MKRDTIILISITTIVALLIIIVLSCALVDNDPDLAEEYYYRLQDLSSLFITMHKAYPSLRTPVDIPVLYINLDRCPERREWMEKQGVQYGFTPIRVTGVDGDKDPSINYRNSYRNLSRSEIGCTLSHLRAIHLAYNMGLTYALIVEDDASFVTCPYWPRTLTQYIAHAPTDWTILRLFSNGSYSEQDEEYLTYLLHKDMATAHILNRAGMKNILDRCVQGEEYILDSSYTFGQADWYIYLVSPLQRIYHINPPLIIPDNRNLRSTIHDDHSSTHYRLASKALPLYLDKVLTSAITKNEPNPLCIEMLYEPVKHRECEREPTYVDIVVNINVTFDINQLRPLLHLLPSSHYRLFGYGRDKELSCPEEIDEITTLNSIGGIEAAFAYHMYVTPNRSQYTLCLSDLNQVEEARQSLSRLSTTNEPSKVEDVTHYTYPTYPPSIPRVTPAPVELRPLGKWYKTVTGTKVEPCPQGKVLLTSSASNHDEDTWYRILLSLSYAQEPETAHYLRKVWYGLCG